MDGERCIGRTLDGIGSDCPIARCDLVLVLGHLWALVGNRVYLQLQRTDRTKVNCVISVQLLLPVFGEHVSLLHVSIAACPVVEAFVQVEVKIVPVRSASLPVSGAKTCFWVDCNRFDQMTCLGNVHI